jgi:hypothetical protein
MEKGLMPVLGIDVNVKSPKSKELARFKMKR